MGNRTFENTEQIYRYLYSIPMFATSGVAAASWGLEGINKLCRLMGEPQQELNAIHIAGTNGKGSVAHYLHHVYKEHGYKTGMYTSPHLEDIRERWRINDRLLNEEQLVQLFQRYGDGIVEIKPTFFELTTAIALRFFADENVDLAVIETGLGGRLDATNIVGPELSIITNVSYDHQAVLGSGIEQIAREKAGIIKPETPILAGSMSETAIQVIRTRSEELDAPFYRPESGNASTGINQKIAERAVQLLHDKYPVDQQKIPEILRRADAGLRGRFERLHPNLNWYFDGAHNPAAVQMMKQKITQIGSCSYATVILSVMEDKAVSDFLKLFSDFQKIYYYPLHVDRAARYEDIARKIQGVEQFPLLETWRYSLLKSLKSELVIFTGSFYFYPLVKQWMRSF